MKKLAVIKALTGLSGLTGLGTAGIAWYIDDQFTTAGGPGIDGAAVPGPGTRVDVNNSISITGGKAVIDNTNDILFYDEAWTRTVGTILVGGLDAAASTDFDVIRFGFDDAKTATPDRNAIGLAAANVINAVTNGTAINIGSYASITTLRLLVNLRSAGAYYYWYNGSQWQLLYFTSTNNTATLYAGVGAITTNPTANLDYFRMPDYTVHTFLPEPLAYDTFTGTGALTTTATTGPDSQACTARTWLTTTGVRNTNQLQVVPTLGAELLTNGNFAAWTGDNPDNWSVVGEAGISEISEVGSGESHGGAGTNAANVFRGDANIPQCRQTSTTVGLWYRIGGTISNVTSGTLIVGDGASKLQVTYTGVGSINHTGLANSTVMRFFSSSLAADITIDDMSVKQITLSSCIAGIDEGSNQNVLASVGLTITANTQAGLMLRLDSTSTPANYLHIYADRTDNKIYVNEVAAGVVTNKSSTAFTYSAGTALVVRLIGTAFYVWYNNTYITNGTTTVAGNTTTAVFMTDTASRADNFTVFPSTTAGQANNQYATFDQYIP